MINDDVLLLLSIVALIGAAVAIVVVLMWKKKMEKMLAENERKDNTTLPLQLQAYERLVLLADRIALDNLVSRVGAEDGRLAKEQQFMLTAHIKQEFEYNISQQVYVSDNAWEAMKNYKDQLLLTINKVGHILPDTASAADMNKRILEVVLLQEGTPLSTVVSVFLSNEAKQLIARN